MIPTYIFGVSIAVLGVVIFACLVVLWTVQKIMDRLHSLEIDNDGIHKNTSTLAREMRRCEDRLDALERRPPVTNVTVQTQSPAPQPKAGAR
jgi:hypothetical protein